jgi:hypothetical protein
MRAVQRGVAFGIWQGVREPCGRWDQRGRGDGVQTNQLMNRFIEPLYKNIFISQKIVVKSSIAEAKFTYLVNFAAWLSKPVTHPRP